MLSLLYGPALTSVHDYWKNHSFEYMHLCQQSDISAFSMLSRFLMVFLPRSKHFLVTWLQSPFAVILEPKKILSLLPLFPLGPLEYRGENPSLFGYLNLKGKKYGLAPHRGIHVLLVFSPSLFQNPSLSPERVQISSWHDVSLNSSQSCGSWKLL